jgi:hypothetical protein
MWLSGDDQAAVALENGTQVLRASVSARAPSGGGAAGERSGGLGAESRWAGQGRLEFDQRAVLNQAAGSLEEARQAHFIHLQVRGPVL